MERKLIKQGGGGCTVYLPKKWLDKKRLKAGDTITINETETSLVIGGTTKEKSAIKIKVTLENEPDLKHVLTHAYRQGFNKIIVSSDKTARRTIRALVHNLLLGFEVTEVKDNELIIENISEPQDSKYETMLRKVFLVIKETQGVVNEGVNSGVYNPGEMDELRNQVDKFIIFCRRILMRDGYTKNILLEWEMLTFLMHIQHTYFYLHEYLTKNNLKLSRNMRIKDFLHELQLQFGIYEKIYYEKNRDDIHRLNRLTKKHHSGTLFESLESSRGHVSVVFSYIRELFRLINIGTSPLLSMCLE